MVGHHRGDTTLPISVEINTKLLLLPLTLFSSNIIFCLIFIVGILMKGFYIEMEYTIYDMHFTPCTIQTARHVQYTLHTLYNYILLVGCPKSISYDILRIWKMSFPCNISLPQVQKHIFWMKSTIWMKSKFHYLPCVTWHDMLGHLGWML